MVTIEGSEFTIGQLAEYAVAVATFFLAIATFYSVWEMRKERKEDVKVEIEEGIQPGMGDPKAPIFIVTAVNNGHRMVMLREIEIWVKDFWVKDSEKLNVKSIIAERYSYGNGRSIDSALPFKLDAGCDFPCGIFLKEISSALTRKGYTGEQKLIARFRSATNRKFKSKPFLFKVETDLATEEGWS